MAALKILFSCSGRLGRLPFLAGVVTVWSVLAAVAHRLGSSPALQAPQSAIIPVSLLGVLCWSLTVLMLKRLTDMGRSRLHIVWILASSLLATVAGPPSLPAGLLVTVLNVAIFAWLLLAPGARNAAPSPRRPA